MKLKYTFLILVLFISTSVFADARKDNPIQTQVLFTSGSMNTHPAASGGSAGLHLGYHFNETFYFGVSAQTYHTNKVDRGSDPYDDYDALGQNGVDDVNLKTGDRYQAELRVFPWTKGVYFSASALSLGKDTIKTIYDVRSRSIGANTYTVGLTADIEYKEKSAGTLGMGFQHVFNSGVSIGTGISYGGEQEPEVEVSATGAVAQADLDSWKKDIEDNERRTLGLFYFAVGYNF